MGNAVGKEGMVNHYVSGELLPAMGQKVKIEGVVERGNQIQGYVVRGGDGKVFSILKKNLFVGRSYVEDIHLDTTKAQAIREVLSHWVKSPHRDYHGSSWDGVEALLFELAKVTNKVAIESAGQYKYQSSTRDSMDGRNWRYVIQDDQPDTFICVNCHSLSHDGVWTLNLTIYSTSDTVDTSRLNWVEHPDHWTRTLLWTRATVGVLQLDGHDYNNVIDRLSKRINRGIPEIKAILNEQLPEVVSVCMDLLEEESIEVPYISVCFARWRVEPHHVGLYESPSDLGTPYGTLTIHPKVYDDKEYLQEVVKHELIHCVLLSAGIHDLHDGMFLEVAEELGLPEEYAD